ncbi:septal ring lytic transglycosylase RlpA family protein [Dongia deserti]|uniref:septal ring lytic transglycosylase RlpA family protein n=1 Tax=Dongia deserti TaxID=2268030 RepID=UPI002547EB59|nr:septal ring lytic transglycosylase RlpA family protein [Dongia deserti]
MQRHILPILLACAAMLAGCTESKVVVDTAKVITNPGPAKPAPYKIGKPYQVNGIWYYPKVDYKYSETGIASWYGPGFHGKYTANGEIYDENGLTAAHRTLPLPSMVRVTNLENGRSIQVRVNDRGPFAAGRIIDMTRRGAQLLGFIDRGTARVRVDIMPEESQQLAALASRQGGDQLPPPPKAAPAGEVIAGGLPPIAGAKVSPGKPQPGVQAPAPAPVAQPGTNIVPVPPPQPDGRVIQVPVKPTSIYIQAGAFLRQINANQLSTQLRKYGPVNVAPVTVERQQFYRVRVGPIASVEDADLTLKRMIADGHPESRIVVD